MLRILTTATVLLNRSKNRRHSSESRQPLISSSTKLKAAEGRRFLKPGERRTPNRRANAGERTQTTTGKGPMRQDLRKTCILLIGYSQWAALSFSGPMCNALGVRTPKLARNDGATASS